MGGLFFSRLSKTHARQPAPPEIPRPRERPGRDDRGERLPARGPVGGDRGKERRTFLLGAAARAGKARLPPPARIRAGAGMKFGVDRLLEDRALRGRLAGRRVALL